MVPTIPPLLTPYLALPPETSLTLLTHVLGASTNWLVLRYLHSALSGPSDANTSEATPAAAPAKVLLVSFMRDLSFWRDGARKLGLDLGKAAQRGRFLFLDGVSGLFVPSRNCEGKARDMRHEMGGSARVLQESSLEAVRQAVLDGIRELQKPQQQGEEGDGEAGRIVLIIDQLDFLLAAGGDEVTAVGMGQLLMDLRQHVQSSILTLAADEPLVQTQQTALETNHTSFVLSVAHQARSILGVRLLDTGTARDVSGVVRITGGGGVDEGDEQNELEKDGKEFLYYVGGDGGVTVFERGQ